MRERLTIAGIIAFVVLDVVLIALAVRHTRSEPPTSYLPPVAESGNKNNDGGGSSAQPQGEPTGKQSQSSFDEPLYMSVAADQTYIRATRGSCEQGNDPRVTVSTDDGASFDPAKPQGVTEVLRVQANGADDLWLVGTNADCRVGFYSTSDQGDSWSRTPGSAGAWNLVNDPDASRIHAPNGTVDTPCVPASLSTIDAGVLRLLCSEGRIIGTESGGESWVALGRLEHAVAIRFTSAGDGYAVAPAGDCPAAVMQTVNGGADWDRLTCLGEAEPRSVAAESGVIAAQVGDDLHVSSDGGSSWETQ